MSARRGSGVLVELVRLVVVAACTGLGYQIARQTVADPTSPSILVSAALGSSIGYVLGGVFGRMTGRILGRVEDRISEVPGADFVSGGLGIVAGAIIGTVISLPLMLLPNRLVGLPIMAFIQITFAFLGFRIALGKREDLLQLFGLTYRTRDASLRVLDTSAILNPQLLDLVRAGLLRGTLLVATFVLEEAQGIADSPDKYRRERARRGLDALDAIRREGLSDVRAVEKTYPEFSEVDAKVTALARERGATLVTDDTNLARVAEIQGIEVLSLRRVAQVLAPTAVPGEQISLELVKAGRQDGQAVGYLDDGSMVVVSDAAGSIGSTVQVAIDRIVPTSGGRMLFAHIAT